MKIMYNLRNCTWAFSGIPLWSPNLRSLCTSFCLRLSLTYFFHAPLFLIWNLREWLFVHEWNHHNCLPNLRSAVNDFLSVIVIFFSRVHATLQPALSVGRSVGWLVGRSVTLYFFLWFYFFDLTAPAQMVWWPQIWPLPTRTRLR